MLGFLFGLIKFTLKILSWVILLFLIAYLVLFVVGDSKWAKDKIKEFIKSNIEKYTDYDIDIENIEKLSPTQLDLNNITIESDNTTIATVNHLSLKWSLAPLLIRQLSINKISIEDVYLISPPPPAISTKKKSNGLKLQ